MTTLFLDFASHRKMMALVQSDETQGIVYIDDHTKEDELLPTLDTLLAQSTLTLGDLCRIAVVTGPGGFMSLRVGLAIANTLGWSLSIPVGGIHLSAVWEARIEKNQEVLWLHSTKKDAIFMRGLGALKAEVPETVMVSPTLLAQDIRESAEYIGELLPEHAKILPVAFAEKYRSLEDALPDIVDSIRYSTPPVLAWYGRGL